MTGMVIEVPEELKALGVAMVEAVAAVTKARAANAGRAVDYAAVESVIGEAAAQIERAGHQAVLRSLDVNRPSVLIGGARFTRVGRCEATYYTMASPVVVERSFERVAHAVGAHYVAAHGDVEDALIEAYEIPEQARSVSVSLDRVSVPMEEPLPRPVGRPK